MSANFQRLLKIFMVMSSHINKVVRSEKSIKLIYLSFVKLIYILSYGYNMQVVRKNDLQKYEHNIKISL